MPKTTVIPREYFVVLAVYIERIKLMSGAISIVPHESDKIKFDTLGTVGDLIAEKLLEQGIAFNRYPTDLRENIVASRYDNDGNNYKVNNPLIGSYLSVEQLESMSSAEISLWIANTKHATRQLNDWSNQEENGDYYTVSQLIK